jgi:hypothetical protein
MTTTVTSITHQAFSPRRARAAVAPAGARRIPPLHSPSQPEGHRTRASVYGDQMA